MCFTSFTLLYSEYQRCMKLYTSALTNPKSVGDGTRYSEKAEVSNLTAQYKHLFLSKKESQVIPGVEGVCSAAGGGVEHGATFAESLFMTLGICFLL